MINMARAFSQICIYYVFAVKGLYVTPSGFRVDFTLIVRNIVSLRDSGHLTFCLYLSPPSGFGVALRMASLQYHLCEIGRVMEVCIQYILNDIVTNNFSI
jgi:hypothetical protein